MKKTIKSHKGVRGRRIKIEPEKSDSLLQLDEGQLVQRGKVIGVGSEATCKVGDIVIFNAWGCDMVTIEGNKFYYILDTDEMVLEIL